MVKNIFKGILFLRCRVCSRICAITNMFPSPRCDVLVSSNDMFQDVDVTMEKMRETCS